MSGVDILSELGLRRWTRRAGVFPDAETAPEPPGPPPAPVLLPSPLSPAPSLPVPVLAGAGAAPGASRPGPAVTDDLFPREGPAPLPDIAWADLPAAAEACTRCKLCTTRTHAVFGEGPPGVGAAGGPGPALGLAPLMVVGEGPGADEDASGRPFVGRAGRLLDEMLRAIGHGRETTTYIANVVKCRPPGNRDPEADEVEACRPYLDRQIEHVRPRLIVALGRVAAQRLLSTSEPLSRLRGATFHYGALRTPVFVTYHPAYLLRTPRDKAKSWQDLKRVWTLVGAGAATPPGAA